MPLLLAQLDARIFYALYGGDDGKLTWLALMLSAIGSGWVMFVLLPLYGLQRFRPFTLRLTMALVTSAAAVGLLKALFARVRPCVALPGVHALCVAPTDQSFPSGHACGSFTVAAFLIVAGAGEWPPLGRVALRAAVVAAAIAIAWSRVYLGVHFPADVVAGGLLGTTIGGGGGWLHVRWLRARSRAEEVAPRGTNEAHQAD